MLFAMHLSHFCPCFRINTIKVLIMFPICGQFRFICSYMCISYKYNYFYRLSKMRMMYPIINSAYNKIHSLDIFLKIGSWWKLCLGNTVQQSIGYWFLSNVFTFMVVIKITLEKEFCQAAISLKLLTHMKILRMICPENNALIPRSK